MRTAYYPRPIILSHSGLDGGHAVIEASAGTGKTYTLEHLVLDLVIRGRAGIEEILVVTFTDAATREVRERVRSLIRRVCDATGALPPGASAGDFWEIDEETRKRLREALFRFDGAAISTIHGFCRRVLSEQAFLGGRLFEEQQTAGEEIFGLVFREEAREALVEEGDTGSRLRGWIEQGRSLSELQGFLYRCHREGCPDRCPLTPAWDPPALTVAVSALPAVGELTVAADHFSGAARKSYLGIFDELEKLRALLENPADRPAATAGLMAWTEKMRTINKVRDTQLGHLERARAIEGVPELFGLLAEATEKVANLVAGDESFFAYSLLPRVQQKLTARKRSLGLLDYDDMLLGVLEAIRGPGGEALLTALRRRWKYTLVDEFQDTDPVQWEIFRKVFVDGGGKHRLIVIGDPKQAIYGFRGADVHTYKWAKLYLSEEHGAKKIPLTENYRSTGAMIEAVNEILAAAVAEGDAFFSGLNSYEEPVTCGSTLRIALGAGGNNAAPVHLVRPYGTGGGVNAAAVGHGLACFIAEEIERLVPRAGGGAAGTGILRTGNGTGDPQPVGYEDIYVLTRSAGEGEKIGAVLRAYGIPHSFYRQEGLFQAEEALNLHRLLLAIDRPDDPAARMAAWLTPFFAVPLNELPAWRDAGAGHPLAALLYEWKGLAEAGSWPRLFDNILTSSGLVRRLVFSGEERALTNYLHLFELLQAEAHASPLTMADLARWLKASIDGRIQPGGREGNVQRLESDRKTVKILTMHKAKGLEAEVVFIGGRFSRGGSSRGTKTSIYHLDGRRRLHVGGAVGSRAELIRQEEREEDQRLLYVALTRARSRLYLPCFGPAADGVDKSYEYKSLGPFYRELQKQLDLLREAGRFDQSALFAVREVSCLKRYPRPSPEVAAAEPTLPADLLQTPLSSRAAADKIEPRSRGVLLTSYTRIRQKQGWNPPAAPGDDEREALRADEIAAEAGFFEEAGEEPAESPLLPKAEPGAFLSGEVALPGGRQVGLFLHALLEETPAGELLHCSFDEWASAEAVRSKAVSAGRRYGLDEDFLPSALQLVYGALRTPVLARSVEGGRQLKMPGGIASGGSGCAEVSFTYPIPENFHPLLSGGRAAGGTTGGSDGAKQEEPLIPPGTGGTTGVTVPAGPGRPGRPGSPEERPFRVRRGYLQGLIDYLFEHEKKIYLVDWKSDRFGSYSPAAVERHVRQNYSLQAQIYTLAVIRMLGIAGPGDYEARFGGVLYLFLRGFTGEGSGLWFSLPPWETVVSWERGLLKRRDWGGAVLDNSL